MFKTIWWSVVGGAILLFGFGMFFQTYQDASGNATATMGNVTNFSGLQSTIEFSPLLMWMGLFAIPLVVIVVFLWQRRQRAGG